MTMCSCSLSTFIIQMNGIWKMDFVNSYLKFCWKFIRKQLLTSNSIEFVCTMNYCSADTIDDDRRLFQFKYFVFFCSFSSETWPQELCNLSINRNTLTTAWFSFGSCYSQNPFWDFSERNGIRVLFVGTRIYCLPCNCFRFLLLF